MKDLYNYISIADNTDSQHQIDDLFKKLEEGYEILSAAGSGFAVHYILHKPIIKTLNLEPMFEQVPQS